MRTGRRADSWFGRMRRDGALFAVLAVLVLIANLFQPLAQAKAAEDGWTICTTHGVTRAGDPGDAEGGHSGECTLCIASNHCGSLSVPKLVPSAEPAFAPLKPLRGPAVAIASAAETGPALYDPPPAIRAPPRSA